MTLQLERRPFEWNGRSYDLVCNMAALDELQERHGGSMRAVLEAEATPVATELFEIMFARARRKAGEEPVPHEVLAEEMTYAMIEDLDIFGMFMRSLSAKSAHAAQDPKN